MGVFLSRIFHIYGILHLPVGVQQHFKFALSTFSTTLSVGVGAFLCLTYSIAGLQQGVYRMINSITAIR
jgi:hypothetical protein